MRLPKRLAPKPSRVPAGMIIEMTVRTLRRRGLCFSGGRRTTKLRSSRLPHAITARTRCVRIVAGGNRDRSFVKTPDAAWGRNPSRCTGGATMICFVEARPRAGRPYRGTFSRTRPKAIVSRRTARGATRVAPRLGKGRIDRPLPAPRVRRKGGPGANLSTGRPAGFCRSGGRSCDGAAGRRPLRPPRRDRTVPRVGGGLANAAPRDVASTSPHGLRRPIYRAIPRCQYKS